MTYACKKSTFYIWVPSLILLSFLTGALFAAYLKWFSDIVTFSIVNDTGVSVKNLKTECKYDGTLVRVSMPYAILPNQNHISFKMIVGGSGIYCKTTALRMDGKPVQIVHGSSLQDTRILTVRLKEN